MPPDRIHSPCRPCIGIALGIELHHAAHFSSVLSRKTGGVNAHRLQVVSLDLRTKAWGAIVGERKPVDHELRLVFGAPADAKPRSLHRASPAGYSRDPAPICRATTAPGLRICLEPICMIEEGRSGSIRVVSAFTVTTVLTGATSSLIANSIGIADPTCTVFETAENPCFSDCDQIDTIRHPVYVGGSLGIGRRATLY